MSSDLVNWIEDQMRLKGGRKYGPVALSREIGVTSSAVSYWLSDKSIPSGENVDRLAAWSGDMEIYDILGLPRPDPRLQAIIENWGRIPNDVQQQLAEEAGRYA